MVNMHTSNGKEFSRHFVKWIRTEQGALRAVAACGDPEFVIGVQIPAWVTCKKCKKTKEYKNAR